MRRFLAAIANALFQPNIDPIVCLLSKMENGCASPSVFITVKGY
jgi:hypothetical protein